MRHLRTAEPDPLRKQAYRPGSSRAARTGSSNPLSAATGAVQGHADTVDPAPWLQT